MIELASERGYRAVTVRELVGLAGVSTRTFYTHFADKQDCFLTSFDLVVARSSRRIASVTHGRRHRQEYWRRALTELARESRSTRFALVNVFEAGESGLARMSPARAAIEEAVARDFQVASAAGIVSPSPLLVKGIVAGVENVTRARVLAGRGDELPDLADGIVDWMLSYRDPAVAAVARLSPRHAPVPPRVTDRADGPVDERICILHAVAQLAVREDHRRLSAARIRTAAGVSRRCFDTHFAGAQPCVAAAFEHFLGRALAHAERVGAMAENGWPLCLHGALGALMDCFARDAALAHIAFVDLCAAGMPGVRCRARIAGRFAENLRAVSPEQVRPSTLAAEASVGAIWGLVREHVLARRTGQLPTLVDLLSLLALAPSLGPRCAAATIAAARTTIVP